MNIIVPIKQVPDTGIPLRINDSFTALEEGGIKWVLNPYDEFALEEALRLKPFLGGQIFALTLGPDRSKEALLNALALGADEAHHLLLEQALFDPLKISFLLAEKIKTLSFSLIFCGKLSTDTNDFAVPQMLAQRLNLSFVTNVNQLTYKEGEGLFNLKRECGGGKEEVLEGKAPLLISVDKGLNEPRFPTLPGIMKAKKKPFYTTSVEEMEGNGNFQLSQLQPPLEKPPSQMISGSPDEQVNQLIDILKEKEKLL